MQCSAANDPVQNDVKGQERRNLYVGGHVACPSNRVAYSDRKRFAVQFSSVWRLTGLQHVAHGGLSTRGGVDMLRLCFDQYHAEGAISGRIMDVRLPPHVIGRPYRSAVLRVFFDYVKSKSDVWMPAREEIATWHLGEAPRHIASR